MDIDRYIMLISAESEKESDNDIDDDATHYTTNRLVWKVRFQPFSYMARPFLIVSSSTCNSNLGHHHLVHQGSSSSLPYIT